MKEQLIFIEKHFLHNGLKPTTETDKKVLCVISTGGKKNI